MEQAKKTAVYRVVADSGGTMVFHFYCDISGELCCVTRPIRADTEEAALELAWATEGKWEFNHCTKCGKYVSSAMFNVNAGLCPDCAPWETEFPSRAMTRRAADWMGDLGGCRPLGILSDDCGDVVWQCHAEQADLLLLEKAVELGLIDGYCIGGLTINQMRTWLAETAETADTPPQP